MQRRACSNELLLRCFLLTSNCLTFSFTCTVVGFSTLTSYRQSFTVTKTTVASDIEQTLDTHLHFRTQGTFYLELIVDGRTDGVQIFIVPIVYFLAAINVVLVQDVTGSGKADTIDIGK